MLNYRQPGIRFFAMLTRVHLWRRSGLKDTLGNFKPKLSPIQLDLFRQFYRLLLEGKGGDPSIIIVAHKLLHSAFKLSLDSRSKVDSAFEQSLIFTIMTPVRDQFISPTAHTQLCAQTQRTIFTTFFHTAWHGGPNSDFKFIDRGAKEVVGNGDSRSTTEGDGTEEGEEHLAMETEDVVDSIPFPRFQQTGPPPLAVADGDDDDDNDGWDNAGVGSGHNVSKDDKEGESSDSGDESEFELLEERQGDDKLLACVVISQC